MDWFNQFKIDREAVITFSGSCSFSVSIVDLYLSEQWAIEVLSSCYSQYESATEVATPMSLLAAEGR
jgi:hypothetical protein